jgi:hypothetical protein
MGVLPQKAKDFIINGFSLVSKFSGSYPIYEANELDVEKIRKKLNYNPEIIQRKNENMFCTNCQQKHFYWENRCPFCEEQSEEYTQSIIDFDSETGCFREKYPNFINILVGDTSLDVLTKNLENKNFVVVQKKW